MEQANSNFFPWDDISEENVFPTGVYHFSVDELEDGMSGTGKRMFRARFTCKAPAEQVGMSHFENYVTGTDENPTGINPGTMGARGLKKMLSKAQVPPSNDPVALCVSAKSAEVLMTMNYYVEKEGQYAGTPRNRIADYHRLGERQVGVTQPLPGQGAPGMPGAGPPMGPAPAPMTGAPSPAPPPGQPVVATPAPQTVAPPAQPQPITQPQPVTQPQQVGGPPPQSVTQPVQPAPGPAPVQQPTGGGAPPPGAPPAGQPATPTMRCTVCQKDVYVSKFGPHVEDHGRGIQQTNVGVVGLDQP